MSSGDDPIGEVSGDGGLEKDLSGGGGGGVHSSRASSSGGSGGSLRGKLDGVDESKEFLDFLCNAFLLDLASLNSASETGDISASFLQMWPPLLSIGTISSCNCNSSSPGGGGNGMLEAGAA